MIPLLDLIGQHKPLKRSIESRWSKLFGNGEFVLGGEVKEFEERMARFLGVKHAISCASGTDALRLALRALQIGPGDEVITTALSFFATAGAIAQEGATPVFVDIDPRTYNIDPSKIEAKINARTRALLPVHLYGCPADMDAIGRLAKKHGLKIIEDAAQATGALWHGRQAGTLGDIGCFSFYPTKNLGALGDGGMVSTQDDALAAALSKLRVHGSSRKYIHDLVGLNSRLDSLQAAVLNSKLGLLDKWNAGRRALAAAYAKELKGLPLRLPVEPAAARHVYHLYVIACDRRDDLAAFLEKKGVQSAVYYPLALPLQPCFASLGHGPLDFPQAVKASGEILAIPLYPEMSMAQVKKVSRAIKEFFA